MVTLATLTVTAPAAGATPAPNGHAAVIADRLDNPRGITVGGGSLYVALAGHGGPTCFSDGQGGTSCVGLTGSVIQLADRDSSAMRSAKTYLSGLISYGGAEGVSGPSAVSYHEGRLFTQMAESPQPIEQHRPPGVPDALYNSARNQLGVLFVSSKPGTRSRYAGVGDEDYEWTQAHKNLVPGQFPDANPNAVLATDDAVWVVDAASNTLDNVEREDPDIANFFPAPAGAMTDTVPTCVAKGRDGALYVAELLGGYYPPGHARVWRVANGHATVWASGLTAVNGCGFGPDGAFYVTEFAKNGLPSSPTADPTSAIVRIDRTGHQTTLNVGMTLDFASGFAADDDAIYVSNCSIAPATGLSPGLCSHGGQLVRIPIRD